MFRPLSNPHFTDTAPSFFAADLDNPLLSAAVLGSDPSIYTQQHIEERAG